MTGLVQDPAVFERFTEAIERGDHESLSLPTTSAHQQKASISSRSGKKGKDLSNSDIVTLLAVYNNLSSLLQIASLNGVRIAFDAEQSWYQPALSRIVTLLSREYNRNNQKEGKIRAPIVYNTYQTNLKATESVLREDLLKAKEGGKMLCYREHFGK